MNKMGGTSDPLVGFLVAGGGDDDPFAGVNSSSKNHASFTANFDASFDLGGSSAGDFVEKGSNSFNSQNQPKRDPKRGVKANKSLQVFGAAGGRDQFGIKDAWHGSGLSSKGHDSQKTEDTSQSTPTYDDLPEDMRPSVPVRSSVFGFEERIARQAKGEVLMDRPKPNNGKAANHASANWNDSVGNFSQSSSQKEEKKKDQFWEDSFHGFISKDEEEFLKGTSEDDAPSPTRVKCVVSRKADATTKTPTGKTITRIRVRSGEGVKMDKETARRLVKEHMAKGKAKKDEGKSDEKIEKRSRSRPKSLSRSGSNRSKSSLKDGTEHSTRSKSRSKDITAEESGRTKTPSKSRTSESGTRSKSRLKDESTRSRSTSKDIPDGSTRSKSRLKSRSDASTTSKDIPEGSTRSKSRVKSRTGDESVRSKSTSRERSPVETTGTMRSKSRLKSRTGEESVRSRSSSRDATESRSSTRPKSRGRTRDKSVEPSSKDEAGEVKTSSSFRRSKVRDPTKESAPKTRTRTSSRSTSRPPSGLQ